jgi:predicted anti-sigma-YlaC factor YlaD
MNCSAVRDGLPEFALGVAPADDASSIELHVETCAACRKEAIDLQRAAASFAYAVAPMETPEPELEDRVVKAIQGIARPSSRSHGRSRRAGVFLLAAAIVVATIGVGTVFAGREEFRRLQAAQNATTNFDTANRFVDVARGLDPTAKVRTGTLTAPSGRGSGAAFTILSPVIQDRLVVIMSDLGDVPLPLSVSISDTKGHRFDMGEVRHLDTGGGWTFARLANASLRGFVDVTVRDAKGHIVLRGTLQSQSTPTPSP